MTDTMSTHLGSGQWHLDAEEPEIATVALALRQQTGPHETNHQFPGLACDVQTHG